MPRSRPTLHLFCGKIASGKSTLAACLARRPRTVLISEDRWLKALYDDELTTGADYMRASTRLQGALGPHVADLLRAGVSVVLDAPANTHAQRAWLRDLIRATECPHRLHLLTPPDAVLLERLRARNASGTHPFTVSEEMFHRFARAFDPPAPDEGFFVIPHGQQA